MNTLSFNINNGRTLKLTQRKHDGATLIFIEDSEGNNEYIPIFNNEAIISAGDMVMLINYFRNCKTGIITSDYIQ